MVSNVVETYTIGQAVQTALGYAQPVLYVCVIAFGLWYYRSYFGAVLGGVRNVAGRVFSRMKPIAEPVTVDTLLTFEQASSYAKALADYHAAHGCTEGLQAALKAGQCLFSETKPDAATK